MNVREIFIHARNRPTEAERSAFLAEVCGSRADVRAEIEALLREHEQLGSFLEDPASLPAITLDEPAVSEYPGAVIGPYKLLEQIGEGGFGLVFMAEQTQPVRRKVALKILKPGMDTRQVVARFEAERQALAIMDHPNIAKVLDGGATESGRPFFVMDLVKGAPITEFCDQDCLPPRQRLELFITVCDAVQHAHQKGIIHRDIKPSNVLVTRHDVSSVVKVIDFGIAKAIGPQLTEKTLFTSLAQMIGTPLYMSPEQAEMSGLDIDTRTDIYALGVLLYELLTGNTPFDRKQFEEAAYDEIRRIIREDEPTRPSARISTVAAVASTVSGNRQTDPQRLSRLLRGELDWIVMKCLEKDRTRRYETASALARDIQRYLNDEPVEAGPPSAIYKVRKLARKHRKLLALVAAFTILLVAATAISVWQAVRATSAEFHAGQERDKAVAEKERADEQTAIAGKERDKAVVERERADEQTAIAEAVNTFLNEGLLFQSAPQMNPDRDLKLRTVLDRASNGIDGRFADRPLVEARLRMTLGNAYASLGELAVAERHTARGRDLYTRHLGPEHRDTLWITNNLGVVFLQQGRLKEARKLLEETYEMEARVLGVEDRDTLRTMINLANLLRDQGHLNDARVLAEKAFELCRRVLGPEDLGTFGATNSLAVTLTTQGQLDKARELYEQVLPIERRVLGPESPYVHTTMLNLANVLVRQGHSDEAYKLYTECLELDRRVLGPEHPDTLVTMYNLAIALDSLGKPGEAIALYEKTLPLQRRVCGESHGDTLNTINNLAWLLATAEDSKLRNPPRAVELAKDVIKARPTSGNNWNSLGIAHYRNGEHQAAIDALEKSERLAPGRYVAHNGFFLAMAYFQRGDKDKARGWHEKALKWMEKNQPNDAELLRFRAETANAISEPEH